LFVKTKCVIGSIGLDAYCFHREILGLSKNSFSD